jgi:3-phenylpropionate/trans-cinnamate dioxygenase ferredoxin reductase subunit
LVQVAGGRWLGYDYLVLATGATPRRLALSGLGLRGVTELRTLDDALVLRRSLAWAERVVVLGGGFIGMEVASAAGKRGVEVTVLERSDRVLSRAVTPPVSEAVAAYHRAEGVRLYMGEQAARVVGRDGHVTGVVTGPRVPGGRRGARRRRDRRGRPRRSGGPRHGRRRAGRPVAHHLRPADLRDR